MSNVASLSPTACLPVRLRSVAAVAHVVFAALKRKFGALLGLLFAARRDRRPVIAGSSFRGLTFARRGDLFVTQTIHDQAGNQAHFSLDPAVVPQTNKARIDQPATLEYLAGRTLSGSIGGLVAPITPGLAGESAARRTPGRSAYLP